MKKHKQKLTFPTRDDRIAKMGAKQLRAELALRDREISELRASLSEYTGFFQSFKDMLRIDRADVARLED